MTWENTANISERRLLHLQKVLSCIELLGVRLWNRWYGWRNDSPYRSVKDVNNGWNPGVRWTLNFLADYSLLTVAWQVIPSLIFAVSQVSVQYACAFSLLPGEWKAFFLIPSHSAVICVYVLHCHQCSLVCERNVVTLFHHRVFIYLFKVTSVLLLYLCSKSR